jgi:hypothetical protein
MKKKISLLTIFGTCLSLFSCSSAKTPIDVIIMGGQSNMVGCSTYSNLADSVGNAKYNEYTSGYKEITIAYDCWTKNGTNDYARQNTSNGKFIASLLGEGNSDLTFGPEIGMAEKFSATRNGKVALIKFACGASSLLDDWAAPASGKQTKMYSSFVSYVKDEIEVLNKAGYAPTIKIMCWMQGEADSFVGYCDEYYQQLTYLVKGFRNDLSSYCDKDGFAFVDAGVSDSTSWPKYTIVNAAKEQFASTSERNVYIDTIAAGLDKTTLQADNAHYQGQYMVKLGNLFAESCEPFLSVLS